MSAEQDDSPSQADLERRRVPLERKISLKFKEFRGFITEYSENLSLGGMFIRTTSPKPPGTIFDFELSLTDDFKLVQGIGEVVWVREGAEPEQAPGMGVRFLDLSAESRKLIQRIVDEHVRRGGTPFELGEPTFPPPPVVRPPSASERAATPPTPALFHATAAPMTAPPPVPPRSAASPPATAPPTARPTPRPASNEPASQLPVPVEAPGQLHAPSPGQRILSPDSPTAHLPRLDTAGRPWSTPPAGVPPPAPAAPAAAATTPPGRPAGAPATAPRAPSAPPASNPPREWSPPLLGGERPPVFAPPSASPSERPVQPPAEPKWEVDELEAFQLEDLDEVRALPPIQPEPASLLPSVDDEESFPASRSTLASAPDVPPALTPRTPAGFDEVARALSLERDSDLASVLEREETVRIERSVLTPPRTPSSFLAAAGEPVPDLEPAAANPRAPFASTRRRPRRRSSAPAIAALVLLLLILGGMATLYLAFPDLLPTWAPRIAGLGPTAGAGDSAGARGGDSSSGGGAAAGEDAETESPIASTGAASTESASTAAGAPTAASDGPATRPETTAGGATGAIRPAPTPDPRVIAAQQQAAAAANPPLPRFTTIDEIWGQRRSGGTVVTLVANGTVPKSAISHFRLEGANPREVVRLRGVASGFTRPTVNVGTLEVQQVRTGYHAKPEGNELHVVIDLASARVRLAQVTTQDNRVELLLVAQ